MTNVLQGPGRRTGDAPTGARVMLLREVATSPIAALFVAERPTDAGSMLAAVKVLKIAADPAMVVGLQEGASRLALLRHRHIVCPEQVLEIDGHLAILSPYVDGVDLLDWVEVLRETNTPMPPRVVCEVLRGVAVALEAAHSRVPWGETRPLRMLHCDLKPSNVMVDRDGELRVLDFGTGSSRLSGTDSPASRRARAYLAPERRLGRPPTHQADIYALGLIGIELLQNGWLRQVPEANPDHDLHLGQVVRHLDLPMRSTADEQTLRSLLLRMAAHNPASRPNAAGAAQTLRRLADRAPGPSLESFAHDHALPWLSHTPEDPDTALMVQVTPLSVEVTGRFPVLAPDPLPPLDEDTNTMGSGQLKKLLENDPTHVFLRDTGWEDPDASLTESIANETEAAIRIARAERRPDVPEPVDLSLPDAARAHPLPPELQPASYGDDLLARAERQAVSYAAIDPFDPVTLASIARQPPPRPLLVRIGLPLLALVSGMMIALGAVLVGVAVGAAIVLAL